MRRVMVVLLLGMLLVPVCRAQEELWDRFGMDDLGQAGQEQGTGVELSPDLKLEEGLGSVLKRAAQQVPETLRTGVRSGLALLAIAVLCAMGEGLRSVGGQNGGLNVCVMAGALAIAGLSAGEVNAMMGLGRATIDSMQGFSNVLLPVTAACTAAVGAPASAAARQVATVLFSNVLLRLIDGLLVPLVYAYTAVCTACAAAGNPGLKKVAGILKWVITKSLTALLILFVSYLTISGAVAGTADAAALKTAKLAIAAAVPVVGKIISNAAETLLVGAGLLKNTVGIFGILGVAGICIVPFLKLGIHYLVYKLTGALGATLADNRLAELIDNLGTAFALMLAMTGASALLLMVSMIFALSGGGGGWN